MVDGDVLAQTIDVIDLVGVLANALLGGAVARAHRLDPVGFAVLAVLSGLGGGMLRDVLLQAGPPLALTNPWYLGTALAGAAIAYVVMFEGKWWDRLFPWVDALALGCWAAVGTQKGLANGLGVMPSTLLGVITAVGGSAIRDVALGMIPKVLGGGNPLYATPALFAAGVQAAFQAAGEPGIGMPVATLAGAALFLIARWRGWILPERIDWRATRAGRLASRARDDAEG